MSLSYHQGLFNVDLNVRESLMVGNSVKVSHCAQLEPVIKFNSDSIRGGQHDNKVTSVTVL